MRSLCCWLPALTMLVASQQLQAPSTQHDPSSQYRKLPVEDPTMWIHEFQKEALETIGWLATTHNQTEFKKFGDGFRFKMMRRSDKIKNGLNAACPKRLWRNMPMEEVSFNFVNDKVRQRENINKLLIATYSD